MHSDTLTRLQTYFSNAGSDFTGNILANSNIATNDSIGTNLLSLYVFHLTTSYTSRRVVVSVLQSLPSLYSNGLHLYWSAVDQSQVANVAVQNG